MNAAGAWAAHLPGVPEAYSPPVEPVKGQMFALAIPRGFVRRTTWIPGAYLVPRDDGRLLVGATVERTGFDERVTARGMRSSGGRHARRAFARRVHGRRNVGGPAAGDARRPSVPRPQRLDGLWLATGHARNGILFAPVTGRLLGAAIAGEPDEALHPFLLERLRTEPALAARSTQS